MAKQNAVRSPGHVPGLLIHDSTGAETKQARSSAANPNALTVEIVAAASGTSSTTVQGTAADNAAAVGNPVLAGSKYNASAPTYTDGDVANLQADVNGNLKTNLAVKLDYVNDSITNYENGLSYTQITTNTTTTIKSGAGVLKGISINNPALLTVANLTITVYDNTAGSGTVIAIITIPYGVTTAMPFCWLDKPLAFATGCTIVTAGPTVTGNLTVGWR